jgi:hypothetical protein
MDSERDVVLADFSRGHSGAFDRDAALKAGHTHGSIWRNVEAGRWIRLYPTVFAFAGTPRTWERDLMAAILWSRGIAAGLSAGRLWDLPGCDDAGVEIMTASRRPMPHSGVTVHHTNRLPHDQTVLVRNFPTTSIERTLMSLAATWPRRNVAIAMDDSFRRGLTDALRIDAFLEKTARRGRPGVRMVRELARQRRVAGELPERGLESLIWQLILDFDLPIPDRQRPISAADGSFIRRADFFYPPDLVVEGQSKKWHTGLFAEEYDADWVNDLQREGYRIVLLTYKHVTVEREKTAALLRRMLRPHSLHASARQARVS